MAGAVEALVEVHEDALGLALVHSHGHTDGVAGSLKGEGGVANLYVVKVDLPEVLRRCGVALGGVGECDIDVGIGKDGAVDPDMLAAEVDAMGTDLQTPHLTADAHVADEMGGVDLGLEQGEVVDHDLLLQQGHELHADDETAHVGNGVGLALDGVVGLHHLHTVQREVEGKGQTHIVYSDRHAGLL